MYTVESKDEILFEKFIRGRCTAEDLERVLHLLDTEEGARYVRGKLDELEREAIDVTDADNVASERILVRLQRRLQNEVVPWRKVVALPQYWLKIAASIALLVALAWGALHYANPENETVYLERITADDTKVHLFLPDSTEVWLNVASKLRFPDEFSKDDRTVFLEGEAFFEVRRDVNRPFKVIAQDVETKVLGTSFNVTALPNRDKVEVLVFTGKVSVSGKTEDGAVHETVLSPHERLTMDIRSKATTKEFLNHIDNYAGWRQNRLAFHKTSMKEVVDVLNHHFRVMIRLDDESMESTSITAKFESKTVDEVLDLICLLVKGKYVKEGNGYRIIGSNDGSK